MYSNNKLEYIDAQNIFDDIDRCMGLESGHMKRLFFEQSDYSPKKSNLFVLTIVSTVAFCSNLDFAIDVLVDALEDRDPSLTPFGAYADLDDIITNVKCGSNFVLI